MGTLSGLRKPHARIEQVIDQVGISQAANQRLKSFSGGMKQG
jgi:ABC-type multidrug transport system ATPase subunit